MRMFRLNPTKITQYNLKSPLQEILDILKICNVDILLNKLDKINVLHPQYTGLIHVASSVGQVDTIKYLLSRGVDVNQRDTRIEYLYKKPNQGPTPLLMSAIYYQKNAMHLLLDHGADPNIAGSFDPCDKYHSQVMPLHWIARHGDVELAKLLIKHQAIIDPQSEAGETPLFQACKHGNVMIMDLLLTHDANFNIQSTDGQNISPLDLIQQSPELNDHYEIYFNNPIKPHL